jgi:hypothetical protein
MNSVDSERVVTDATANHGRALRLIMAVNNRHLGYVKLTADELTTNFASGPWAEKYPPILTIAQAAEMLQVPVGTLRFWRTTGRLNGCSRRYGRVLRFYRDRLIRWFFEGEGRRGA